jgi:hypothetical protein
MRISEKISRKRGITMAKRKKLADNEAFVFCNGAIAKTVAQAKKEIKNLNPDQFSFHINDQKNDVYNWIHDCVDKELAEKIKDIKTQPELIAALK